MIRDQIYFFIVGLFCEVAGTLSGFGSSVLFVPMAGFMLPRPQVLGITSLLHVFSNTVKVLMFWKYIHRKVFLQFGIPSLLLTVAGAYLVNHIPSHVAEVVLGLFLLSLAVFMFFFPHVQLKATITNATITGSTAGFFAGLLGTGGAIRGAGLLAFGLSKEAFVATSAAIDSGVDISRMFIYLSHGFFTERILLLIPALLLASWLGTWLGKRLLQKISVELFRRIVLSIILVMGAVLVLKHL